MSSKIDLQRPDMQVYLVDPIVPNDKKIMDFVHNIEFPNDIKPNLEIKDEPMDMESSVVEQPMRNEKIFEDFEYNNEQVHIQNFSNTLEAAMLWSNFSPMKTLEIPQYLEQVAIQNEEQRLFNIELRKAKFDKVELKNFKSSACDKNEAKNIGLLYNLPGVPGTSMLRKKAEKLEPRIE